MIGLLGGLLAGAFATVALFRRNLRKEYEHDVRDAVSRKSRAHRDRQRQHREQLTKETGVIVKESSRPPVAPTVEIPAPVFGGSAVDHTVEMPTMPEVDFELAGTEPAKTGDPETLDMPGIGNDLDLQLPEDKGQTGQHEVDFDLLEQAYSEDYQAEFVKKDSDADDTDTKGDEEDRFYHLENRDPTDDTPLPIELGEDEMGTENADKDKIVRFRTK